jgi:hypothetical protein
MQISYDLLVRIFGKPLSGDGEKVTTEWRMTFEDGTIATIYDYYTFETYPLPKPEHNINWHIGGKDPSSVALVEEVIFNYQLANLEVSL